MCRLTSLSVRSSQDSPYSASLLPPAVLLKFRTDKGRDPSSDAFGEDSELLLQIRNDVLDSLGVSPELLPADFVRSVSAHATLRPGWETPALSAGLKLGRCF